MKIRIVFITVYLDFQVMSNSVLGSSIFSKLTANVVENTVNTSCHLKMNV